MRKYPIYICSHPLSHQANIYVRLAALVYLRSTVRELWRKRENGICEIDKETLKASILDGLVKCTESTKF